MNLNDNEISCQFPIKFIGASAGSGKTHRLASEFVEAITGQNTQQRIPPGKILATTFTNKAADELVERVRLSLLAAGEVESSLIVQTGYVGTVNSVCGQLVQEYCFESGISPALNILPAPRVPVVFARAAASAIESISEAAEQAAVRLSLPNWHSAVTRIAELARSNGMAPGQLPDSFERSWQGMSAILPCRPGKEPAALDLALSAAIDSALPVLESAADETKKTRDVITKLKEKRSLLRSAGELPWSDWAQLTKLSPGKSSLSYIEPVLRAAEQHPYHPRLHADIKLYLATLFDCACQALLQYEAYKRENAFIDFTDQEFLLLELLRLPEIRTRISERVEMVLVDEFQDTSPVQLDIFLKLAGLVKRSVWVGDEKQAIYGFRGSDAELMLALAKLSSTGNNWERTQLERSYRSRPELVAFTNSVFKLAFTQCGLPAENVILKDCNRPLQDRLGCPLHLWRMCEKSWDQALLSLSTSVKEIMDHPDQWPVEDANTKEIRDIKGQDIAILCRSNDRCLAASTALSGLGLSVARKRLGLLETPECILAFAALRFLVDRSDTLAAAEIIHLGSGAEASGGRWLEDWLRAGAEQMLPAVPVLKSLDSARNRLLHLTPGEALELALSAASVLATVQAWSNGRQRLANLDALRGLAREYEEFCLAGRSAATAAGFVTYLFRDVPQGGEQTPVADESAVNVVTYHGAKGLEWPLVILLDLDHVGDSNPFGIAVESQSAVIDIRNPLEGRWIRCWPWPYGKQEKNVFLDTAVDGTSVKTSVRTQEREEAIRLLYVGMTRARDYLIFCARETAQGTAWLELLNGSSAEAQDILSFHRLAAPGLQEVSAGGTLHHIDIRELKAPGIDSGSHPTSRSATLAQVQVCSESTGFLPYKLVPSKCSNEPAESAPSPPQDAIAESLPEPLPGAFPESSLKEPDTEILSLGPRLPLTGNPDMELLGEVMHRFLAVDPLIDAQDYEKRIALARRLCQRWGVQEMPDESFLEASNRLRRFLDQQYKGARIWHEQSICGRIGQQRVNGRIDLLVEMPDSFVIIDHKTYPGRFETWISKARSHRPQLAVYADLVMHASAKNVAGLLVHMPVVGKIVYITST